MICMAIFLIQRIFILRSIYDAIHCKKLHGTPALSKFPLDVFELSLDSRFLLRIVQRKQERL